VGVQFQEAGIRHWPSSCSSGGELRVTATPHKSRARR
jgi:hypothetical protein